MPQDDESLARNRFLAINAIRIAGVAMILMGILVVRGVVVLPDWTGYLLLVLGMAETFLVPTMLARLWATNPPKGPKDR